jgi:hypothetical protein
MKIHYTEDLELHDEAQALVDFDMESIRRMISAQRDPAPSVWVAVPEGYQQEGHILRDSESIRLVAYVLDSGTIYATDGCNSCRYKSRMEKASPDELESLSERIQLPYAILRLLAQLVSERSAER